IYFYLKLTSRKHEEETYKKSGKKFLIYAGVLIVVVIFLIFLSGVGIQKRIATTKRQIQFSEGSIGQRYLMWTVGLKMAKENPVLGVGVGMFRLLYPDYQGQFLMDKKFLRQNTHARHPHNEVIENANELGIFGFTVFLWFFASIFIFGLRLLRSLRNDRLFPYLLGAFITVIVMMIHELVSVVLRYASPMISLWSAIGFIAVIYKLRVKTLASSEYTEKNCLIQIKEQTIIRFRPVLVGAAILIFIFNLFWTGNNYRILIGSKYFSNGLGIMDLVSTRNLPPNLPKEFMDADKFNLAVKSFEYFEKSSKYDPKYLNNYYRMGNCFLLMRECYKNYFIVYSRLRKLEPNIPEQYILLYRQIQDSLETVNRVMDNPDNPDEYFEKAAEYFREGDKYKPSYSEINFNLGICLYNLGKNRDPEKIRESIEYIKRAIEIEPINVNALKKLGNIYFETGQEEEARKVYDRLFQVLRTELEIDSRILEFEKEKIGRQDFSFRNLERRFEMLSVNYRKTLLNRDEVYEKAKAVKNEKLQDEYYKLFIDELRKFRDLLKDRVLIYQDLQKRDDVKLTSEEINIIKKTIEVDLNDYFWAVYREGKLHRDYNDIEAVEKVFSEGLDFGPVKSDRNKSVLLMNKLTDYYWELNLNEKLYSYLDQLTEQTPSDLRFEIKRSLFLYLGKDYAGSSGTIVKISDRIKDFSVYNLVVESYADRQPKVIADYFIFASEYDKRNRTDLLQQAGLIYVQSLKDYANAKKAFMKYIQVNPNSHIGYYSLGSVYFVEQNYKEALKNWEKALELDPGNSDLQNNVKLVREKVKEK
ncbi:MAG: tetratricopeptide repeat protein, partial [bacterium]|nr:tetratricopeptide repeat protein [bacterium]